jgi:uncharacterized membrane protein
MHIGVTSDKVCIRDSVWLLWLVGVVFILVSLVAGPLGLFVNSDDMTNADKAVAVLMGAVGVAAGTFIIWSQPRSTITVSPADESLHVQRTGLFRNERRSIRKSEILRIEVARNTDSDRITWWRIYLVSSQTERIPVSLTLTRNEARCQNIARELRAALKL